MAVPKLLERLKKSLEAKGNSKDSSFALATSILEKNGYLRPGTQTLTPKGVMKQKLPEGTAGLGKPKARLKARITKKK